MENGLSAADVALLNDGGNGAFGSSGMWIFGLIILMGLFNGGFNNNTYDRPASQSDVQYTSQFGQILDGNRDILNQISNGTAQAVAATNNAAFNNINVIKDAQMQLQERLADIHTNQQAIIANQNECCCTTRMEIANQAAGINNAIQQNRYESALNTAAINANTTEQTQKILDAISNNRMADMQNQINELQLQQATSGVLRYPMSATYSTPMPWWGSNCNCGV